MNRDGKLTHLIGLAHDVIRELDKIQNIYSDMFRKHTAGVEG